MPRLITQAAYARHRGVSREAVRKAVEQGRISLVKGKVDPAKADKQWAKTTLPRAAQGAKPARKVSKAGHKPADMGPKRGTYLDARTRREEVAVQIAELDLKERAGMLIDADLARARTFHNQRALRDLFQGTTDRVAPRMIMQTEPVIRRVLDEEIHRVLTVIANAPTL
jgi:hypothetical protein